MRTESIDDSQSGLGWLNWSVPLFDLGGISYRLSWTLMLLMLFGVVAVIKVHHYLWIPVAAALPLLVVFLHTLGHALALRAVRGHAGNALLWAYGDMTPMRISMTPFRQFVVPASGILVSLVLACVCNLLLDAGLTSWSAWWAFISGSYQNFITSGLAMGAANDSLLVYLWSEAAAYSLVIAIINLFPARIFDGGRLWRAILWPFFGLRRAVWITIIAGLALSGLGILVAVDGRNFFGIIFFVSILLTCIAEFRSMKHLGYDPLLEVEPAYASRDSSAKPGIFSRLAAYRQARVRARHELEEQQEQVILDRLLAKVSEQGLPSLTSHERQELARISKHQKARGA